ncbi:MAG: GatB/YqeY domain-containing protein [Saprospiraceae bacterium]|nr:GatB/YqeY domain-containing protein [Saprospiraceae bacterium]
MDLETKINTDLKEAMKAKDEAALRAIRSIKSAILLFKTSGSGEELDDSNAIKMLQKMVKQRKESIAIFEQQKREDLAKIEKEEVSVIERYLPKQLSVEAIEAEVKDIIHTLGATSIKDMGKVIGQANQRLAGQAEGKIIADAVKKLLGNV